MVLRNFLDHLVKTCLGVVLDELHVRRVELNTPFNIGCVGSIIFAVV
jgi:hypothetical protein